MKRLKINDFEIEVPYEPYPAQIMAITKILTCLSEGKSALIESPTGTGKTLSILCSALAHIKKFPKKIFICSRTHKQLDQMVEQLKKINYKSRVAILASKQQLCINPALKNSHDINTDCNNLLKENKCSFYNNREKLIDNITKPCNIEEIKLIGKRCNGCPYYAQRQIQDDASIVFAPYNYIIDPRIRDAMGINLKDSVVIIDEAHNIEDFCRSAGSLSFDSNISEFVCGEILKICTKNWGENVKNDLFFLLSILHTFRLYGTKGYQSSKLEQKDKLDYLYDIKRTKTTDSVDMNNIKDSKEITKEINLIKYSIHDVRNFKNKMFTDKKEEIKKGKEIITFLESLGITPEHVVNLKSCIKKFTKNDEYKDFLSRMSIQLLESMAFSLEIIFFNSPEAYNFACRRTHNSYKIDFWLLDASIIFNPLARSVFSIILMSGTLTPFKGFSSELGYNFEHVVEAPHVIKKENVFVCAVKNGHLNRELLGNFMNSENNDYMTQITHIIQNIKKNTCKGGILVFVPSYSFLEKLEMKIKNDKNIFFEPRTNEKFKATYSKFKVNIRENGTPILICVYRGRASEGVDFTDQYARAVIAIGIPYPNARDLEVVCKREYNNRYKDVKGSAWYEIQAFRAVNQAIGRVVRHREDWGGVFLIDCRYTEKRYQNTLSKWVKENLISYNKIEECLTNYKTFVNSKSLNKQ